MAAGRDFNWSSLVGTEPSAFCLAPEGEAYAAPAALHRNWLEAIAAGADLASAVRAEQEASKAAADPDGGLCGLADACPAELPRTMGSDELPESDDESGEPITQAQRDAGNEREVAAAAVPYRMPVPPVRSILRATGGDLRRVRQRVTIGPTLTRFYRVE